MRILFTIALFFIHVSAYADVRIIYEHDNGNMAVVLPAKNSKLTFDEIIQKSVPPGKQYKIIDSADLPKDRKTREQWRMNGHQDRGKDFGRAKLDQERKK